MRKKAAFAALVAGAVCAAVPALAAAPKLGAYSWSNDREGAVLFLAVGEPPRIEDAMASIFACHGGDPIEITKSIEVKASGKFSYKGKAVFVGGDRTRVNFSGSFVTATTAEGKVKAARCKGDKLSFKARRSSGP